MMAGRREWQEIVRKLTEESAEERAQLESVINNSPTSGPELDPKVCRRRLEAEHGQVWDSYELARDFDIEAFAPPLVCVRRRADGVLGIVVYQHSPRFYWGFEAAG